MTTTGKEKRRGPARFPQVSDGVHLFPRPLRDFQCFQLTEDPGNKRTETTRDADLILDLCPSG